MTERAKSDLWRIHLRDQAATRRAYREWRDERMFRSLMESYPGKPSPGTALRVKNGKHRLALVRL